MRTRTLLGLGFLTLALAAGALHCGGSTSSSTGTPASGIDGGGTPPPGSGPPPTGLGAPKYHRPSADACSMSRGPGLQGDAGADAGGGFPGSCQNDTQCTMGMNGRCAQSRVGPTCSYDECFVDSDCGSGKVCDCGATSSTGPQRAPNTCLPGNCRVDADCGAGSYCSPTLDTSCGPYDGTVGYYCHTPNDECTNDDQCTDGGQFGYCAYDPMKSHWVCGHSLCAG